MKMVFSGTHHQCRIKPVLLLFTILAMSGIGHAAERQPKESVIATNSVLIGKWMGEGEFLGKDIAKDIGKVALEFEISKDGAVTGKIGEAKLTETSIHKARYGIEIHGILDAPVKKDKAKKKDHLIILFVTPVKDKDGGLVSDANFHLKSNYVWDFTMCVGGVMLKKQP